MPAGRWIRRPFPSSLTGFTDRISPGRPKRGVRHWAFHCPEHRRRAQRLHSGGAFGGKPHPLYGGAEVGGQACRQRRSLWLTAWSRIGSAPFCRRGCLPAAGASDQRGDPGRKRLSRIPDSRGKRREKGAGGWLSVGSFSNVPFEVIEKTTAFQGELLEIAFTRRKRLRSGRNTATAVFAGSSWSECGKGPSGGSGGGDPSVSERAVYRGKRRSNPLPTGVGERSGRI